MERLLEFLNDEAGITSGGPTAYASRQDRRATIRSLLRRAAVARAALWAQRSEGLPNRLMASRLLAGIRYAWDMQYGHRTTSGLTAIRRGLSGRRLCPTHRQEDDGGLPPLQRGHSVRQLPCRLAEPPTSACGTKPRFHSSTGSSVVKGEAAVWRTHLPFAL
jgi:hypothetical protein